MGEPENSMDCLRNVLKFLTIIVNLGKNNLSLFFFLLISEKLSFFRKPMAKVILCLRFVSVIGQFLLYFPPPSSALVEMHPKLALQILKL